MKRTWYPRLLTVALCVLGPAGCMAPQTPLQRLNNSAYDLNVATRFGRMDVAAAHVSADEQEAFAERRASWGKKLRLLDVEMLGLRVLSDDAVEIRLTFTWQRLDGAIMEETEIAQRWELSRDDWRLTEERRVDGSAGLFVERPDRPNKTQPKDPDPGQGQL